jgi:hypothetical protein
LQYDTSRNAARQCLPAEFQANSSRLTETLQRQKSQVRILETTQHLHT